MTTRKILKELGGTMRPPAMFQRQTIDMPDGSVWRERESENGNGWYAGDAGNPDNLIFDELKS